MVTRSVYDANTGRLEAKEFFDNLTQYDDGNGTPAEVWAYTYDAFGRVVQVDEPGGRTVTREYDAQGRLIVEDTPEGVLGYTYDDLGRLTETAVYDAGDDPATDTPQRTTSYTYDELGRLETVTEDRDATSGSEALLTTTYEYDLLGNLDATLLPSGVIEDYEYDSLNRLDTLTTFVDDGTVNGVYDSGSDTLIASYDYTVRADGKRTGVTEVLETGSGTVTNVIGWEYDNLGRLIEEDFDSTDNSLDFVTTYEFDLTGNRLTKETDLDGDQTADETVTYTYDSNDRLLTEELDTDGQSGAEQTTTYDYDLTQQTGKTVSDSVPSVILEVTYGYNLQGRLETVTTDDGTTETVADYEYDANGVRIKQTVTIDAGTPVLTEYLIDSHNHTGYAKPIREIVDSTVAVDYTLGHQIVSQQDVAGDPLFFIHDGHGSTRVLLDDTAAVTATYHYDAYGNAHGFDASTAVTSWLFAGDGQYDQAAGLTYHLDRWRDGFAWLTKDPFFGNHDDPQSFHKYLYVHADPINGVDPTGLYFSGIFGALHGYGSSLSDLFNGHLGGVAPRINTNSLNFTSADELIDTIRLSAELQLSYIRETFSQGRGLAMAASRFAFQMIDFMMDHFAFDE